MRNSASSTLIYVYAALFVVLTLGFIASDAWRNEHSDASIRRICETQNVADIQIHECMIRLAMRGSPKERLDQR